MHVQALVDSASRGDEGAWNALVRRYRSLVFAVCRGLGVTGADAQDIEGDVWPRLVANLHSLRNPEALPGWIATTTRRGCLQLLRDRNRQIPDTTEIECPDPGPDADLLVDERRTALREALSQLSDRDQLLLALLFCDPPVPYTVISTRLGMPIGAIGPTRQRCLARVRRTPVIAALLA
ncbi:RNA polymerase sigma factor (sigma-70 family) [Kibdelosporangium banguiense]|uniref:RNA polymerase sigma factor (Sigma-70 family) n=1 Tax=Kibdelosporangium banguiense TaxID=1365924 RepID=A0ABS4TJ01_9PSEU|nr:sigma-70 family RNA polymerase sigma factor [Kibdelosporangium banguiense]MBP2324394.1 RNA polymerase sigma factor (sigma-70 family) [Kibdelosporangium banguiense]